MTGVQNITLIQKINGERYITFTFGTSYFNPTQTAPIYNLTGTDNEGNNYTATGFFDKCYKLIVQNLLQV